MTAACWEWTGYINPRGYGQFMPTWTTATTAHRYSYELAHGPIPKAEVELCVCHHCDNPKCVRPDHLFLGTDAENQADKVRKGRQAKGPKLAAAVRAGHERRRQRMSKAVGLVQSDSGGGDAPPR